MKMQDDDWFLSAQSLWDKVFRAVATRDLTEKDTFTADSWTMHTLKCFLSTDCRYHEAQKQEKICDEPCIWAGETEKPFESVTFNEVCASNRSDVLMLCSAHMHWPLCGVVSIGSHVSLDSTRMHHVLSLISGLYWCLKPAWFYINLHCGQNHRAFVLAFAFEIFAIVLRWDCIPWSSRHETPLCATHCLSIHSSPTPVFWSKSTRLLNFL